MSNVSLEKFDSVKEEFEETLASNLPFLSRGQPLEEGLYIQMQQPAGAASKSAQTPSKASKPITEFFAGNHASLSNYFGM